MATGIAEYTVHGDGRFSTTLAFALSLTDAVTGLAPLGSLAFLLDGRRVDIPRNPSGYRLLLDLPLSLPDESTASYRLTVESEFYFPLTIADIRPRELDRRSPVVEAVLRPLPAYPFARGATLLRGMVQGPDGRPVEGATVEVRQSAFRGESTARGEFALFFRGLTPDDVELSGGRRLLAVQDSTNLRVRARHPDFRSGTITMQIEEGKENRATGPIQLRPL